MAKHMEGCPKSFSYVQHLKKKYIHINVNIQILHTCHIVVLMYEEVTKMSVNIYIYTYKCKYSDFAYMPCFCSNVCGSQEDEC